MCTNMSTNFNPQESKKKKSVVSKTYLAIRSVHECLWYGEHVS